MSSITFFLGTSLLLGNAFALPYERIDIESSLIYDPSEVANNTYECASSSIFLLIKT